MYVMDGRVIKQKEPTLDVSLRQMLGETRQEAAVRSSSIHDLQFGGLL